MSVSQITVEKLKVPLACPFGLLASYRGLARTKEMEGQRIGSMLESTRRVPMGGKRESDCTPVIRSFVAE